jgi:hypothetical protein
LIGNKKKHDLEKTQELPKSFQGDYRIFLPISILQEATKNKGPPRTSIYDDLIYYLQHHHDSLELSAGTTASILFLYKIIASESVLLAQYSRVF